jgi:uncharacterized repeat protein (TIGR01451 family)
LLLTTILQAHILNSLGFMKLKNCLSLLLLLFAITILHGQCIIHLQPGPAEGKDTHVFGMDCNSSWAQSNASCDTTNFANSPRNFAAAWTWWGTPGLVRSFLEFDLDSLANIGCSVSAATLYLTPDPQHVEYNCGAGSTFQSCNDNTILLSRVTQPWSETSVNFVNQPLVANAIPGIDFLLTSNDPMPYAPATYDLTDMVNFWLANPTQNFGFRLALANEVYYSRVHHCTSDFPNPALRPRLELTLNCPGACDRMLEGDIYYDANANCVREPGDFGLQNWLVEIMPGPTYATADANGHWQAYVGNAATYTLSQYIPNHNLWDSICPLPYVRTVTGLVSGQILSGQDFALDADVFCADPSVDIVTGLLRPCHVSPVSVQYCNNGNDTLNGAMVTVTADPALTFTYSTLPWNQPQVGNLYVFAVGDLAPGQCGAFTINAMVDCNAVIGQAICVEAEISPVDSCVFTPIDTAWDHSSIVLDGGCVGDSAVCFLIINTGSPANGNMTAPSPYRIYDNGQLVYTGTFQLCGGCNTTICWPSNNGHTIRMEADQHPAHPGNSHPSANVEDCGDSLGLSYRGFVTAMAQDDEDDHIEIFCDVVVNSYDPNDKLHMPSGIGIDHQTEPGGKMEYTIRFQNTGTAPAIDVRVLDVLSPYLSVPSVRPGASSHPYTFRIFGAGNVEFTFTGINLPDSTNDEPNSHGFVKFTVDMADGIALGSRIENMAEIYFDNNIAVLTPTVFNTIGLPTSVAHPRPELLLGEISLFPNPAKDRLTVAWERLKGQVAISVIDLAGRTLQFVDAIPANGQGQYTLDVSKLPSAVYFIRLESGVQRGVVKFVKQ